MKKHILFLLFYTCPMYYIIAQTFSPEVIASAGDHYYFNNFNLSWTIGENIIETFSNSDYILTQGFHQGDNVITNIYNKPGYNVNFILYPNPAVEKVQLKIISADSKTEYSIKIVNPEGKTLKFHEFAGNITEIDISAISQGMYFLLLKNEKGEIINVNKFEKIR